MGHRALGLMILVAGGLLAAVTQVVGKSPSVSMLVVSAALVATGLGLILAPGRSSRSAGRGESRRDELLASLAVAEPGDDGLAESGGLQLAFAVAKGEDGRLQAVDRSEVDAYFECLLVRWRGPLALAMSGEDEEEAAAALADALAGAATELRGDILQAERYLGSLLFREPSTEHPYTTVLADLDGLLRRLGDSRWGGLPAGREPTP